MVIYMNRYLYKDLSKRAQKIALDDYIDGWKETHDEWIDREEFHEILLGDEEYFYDKNGNLLEEEF